MANILIVDDRQENRDFLKTLLGYRGHVVRESSDGQEALASVRTALPDLVISDVLMPNMDGYEFVRQIRADSDLAGLKIVFFTAHYLEREATSLAGKAGVQYILRKPCEPQEVLAVVEAALRGSAAVPPAPSELGEKHLRLVTDQLAKKAEELRLANLRLGALMEACRKMSFEREPQQLVDRYARAAREIIGACRAVIRITGTQGWEQVGTSGMEQPEERPGSDDDALTVPISTPSRTYGWLKMTGKLGGGPFEEDDTSVALALAGQLAVGYENASLYDELRRQSDKLDERVRERTAHLISANNALEEFTSTVAHELRRPIARSRALAEALIGRSGSGDSGEVKIASQIRDEMEHVAELLAALEKLSRATRGVSPQAAVDLGAAVDEIVAEMSSSRPGAIEWRRTDRLPEVSGQPVLLRQALWNLLCNAVKFTGRQERAVIEIGRSHVDRSAFFVRDNGVGFNPEDAPRLFKPFEKLHGDDEFPGVGLGLAVTRAIIQAHGGEIWAEGIPGFGATFYFRLPERS